jgi:hypothetical protein
MVEVRPELVDLGGGPRRLKVLLTPPVALTTMDAQCQNRVTKSGSKIA